MPILNASNVALEEMMKELKLPSTCMINGCDFSADLENVQRHEGLCPFRIVKCVVLDCYQEIRFNDFENHMNEKHPDMSSGEWIIRPFVNNNNGAQVLLHYRKRSTTKTSNEICTNFAMRTWRYSGKRFFATLVLHNVWHVIEGGQLRCRNMHTMMTCRQCGNPAILALTSNQNLETFWNIWVTAACNESEASKFRSEIRLASNNQPECTMVSHRPILHLESDILNTSDLSTYPACLEVSWKTVANYIEDKKSKELMVGREIPFSCRVHEKVFLNLGKADIDEKEAPLEDNQSDEGDDDMGRETQLGHQQQPGPCGPSGAVMGSAAGWNTAAAYSNPIEGVSGVNYLGVNIGALTMNPAVVATPLNQAGWGLIGNLQQGGAAGRASSFRGRGRGGRGGR